MVWRVAGISKLRVKKLAGASCLEARPAPPSSPYPGIVGTRPPFSVDSALPALVSRASSGGWPGSGSPGELRVVSLMGGVLRLPWPRTPPAVVFSDRAQEAREGIAESNRGENGGFLPTVPGDGRLGGADHVPLGRELETTRSRGQRIPVIAFAPRATTPLQCRAI